MKKDTPTEQVTVSNKQMIIFPGLINNCCFRYIHHRVITHVNIKQKFNAFFIQLNIKQVHTQIMLYIPVRSSKGIKYLTE